MILLTLLIHVATAHACYSGESRTACINGNRSKAQDLFRQRDACRIEQGAAQQRALAARSNLASLASKSARVKSGLELARSELAFIASSREDEPALFAGGPRLQDLPQFRSNLMRWDEIAAPARAARLTKVAKDLDEEERALAAAFASASKESEASETGAAAVKATCESLHNSATHHLQLLENACNDICPRGPTGPNMF